MRRKFFLMLTIASAAFVFSTTASAQQRFVGYLTGMRLYRNVGMHPVKELQRVVTGGG